MTATATKLRGYVIERNGRWQVGFPNGSDPFTRKRRRIFRTCDSEAEANAVLAERNEAYGARAEPQRATVGVALERYLRSLDPEEYSPATLRGYRSIVSSTLLPAFEHMPLEHLTTERIAELYDRLRTTGGAAGRPVSQSRIRRIHAVLNPALRLACGPDNPAANVSLGRQKRRKNQRRAKKVAVDDVAKVLAECGPEILEVALFALATSRRAGECCGVQWCDVDFDAETVEILRTIAEVEAGELIPVDDERRKSDDVTLALDEHVVAMLRARRRRQREIALAFGTPLAEDGYVFSEVPGGYEPLAPSIVSGRWRHAAKRAGVSVRFHDLRHFNVSALLAAGIPIPDVAEIAGHDPHITASVYAHAMGNVNRKAAQVMGAIITDLVPASPRR